MNKRPCLECNKHDRISTTLVKDDICYHILVDEYVCIMMQYSLTDIYMG